MTTTIIGPVDLSAATKTGPRVFRKQILRKGTIHYPVKGGGKRRIDFDDKYIADLAASFKAGAYDNVPFILADEHNRHTMAPERWRGWVKGVEVTPDGLDAVIELAPDAAELVEATGGKLGVSPRIRPVEHVDGRRFDLAINHVLGTLDQRQQGPALRLRDWQAVDLSTDPTETVLDLSSATYEEGITMPHIIDLSQLDDDQAEALMSFAAANDIDLADAEVNVPAVDEDDDEGAEGEPTDEGEDEGEDGAEDESRADPAQTISDEELDAMIEAELAAQGVDVSLSDEDGHDETVDLARGQAGDAQDRAVAALSEAARLRFEVAARDYRDAGVPPHLLDLAAPILSLSEDEADQLDLSSPATGEPVDVRGIVTAMLDAVKGTIDLARENGYSHESEDDAKTQDETTSRWIDFLENN